MRPQIMEAFIFSSAFMDAVLHGEGSFIERRERSPCSQSAWRTPSDAAADPFLTDRGCSVFRARFAHERARERQHVPPRPYPHGEDLHRSVNLHGTKREGEPEHRFGEAGLLFAARAAKGGRALAFRPLEETRRPVSKLGLD